MYGFKLYKKPHRYFIILASCLIGRSQELKLWAYRPSSFQAFGPSSLQAFKPSGLQAFRPSSLGAFKPSDHLAFGPSSLRAFTPLGLRIFGPSSLWAFESLGLRVFGPSSLWAWALALLLPGRSQRELFLSASSEILPFSSLTFPASPFFKCSFEGGRQKVLTNKSQVQLNLKEEI